MFFRTMLVVWIALLLPGVAAPEETSEATNESKGWSFDFSPRDDVFPRYLADPRRPSLTIETMSFDETEIAGAGDSRFSLRAGGRYGLWRWQREGGARDVLQIDVDAGFIAQFDRDQSTDNIGWDGLYGLQIAWARSGSWALRAGLFHDSSHIGDEFIEETGRQRIDYTREEWFFGISWEPARHWRLYGEAGRAYDLRNEALQDTWRGQAGCEYVSPPRLFADRVSWYAATDASSFAERDWDLNVTIQGGLAIHRDAQFRTYRAGLEYYDGRSQIGEFFLEDERYLAIGLWFDL